MGEILSLVREFLVRVKELHVDLADVFDIHVFYKCMCVHAYTAIHIFLSSKTLDEFL